MYGFLLMTFSRAIPCMGQTEQGFSCFPCYSLQVCNEIDIDTFSNAAFLEGHGGSPLSYPRYDSNNLFIMLF